jgi:hypothetical protein
MIILNTVYFIVFVLVLTGTTAVCKVAFDAIFAHEEQQTTNAQVVTVTTQELVDAVLLAHNDMLANLQANKEAETSSINEATAIGVLGAQEVIDKRAYELKCLITEKRKAREQHMQNITETYLDAKEVTA